MFAFLHNKFFVRELEQMAVAFAVAFGGAALSGNLARAALVGGVSAGLRAAYGVFVKNVGEPEQPQVK